MHLDAEVGVAPGILPRLEGALRTRLDIVVRNFLDNSLSVLLNGAR